MIWGLSSPINSTGSVNQRFRFGKLSERDPLGLLTTTLRYHLTGPEKMARSPVKRTYKGPSTNLSVTSSFSNDSQAGRCRSGFQKPFYPAHLRDEDEWSPPKHLAEPMPFSRDACRRAIGRPVRCSFSTRLSILTVSDLNHGILTVDPLKPKGSNSVANGAHHISDHFGFVTLFLYPVLTHTMTIWS